MGKNLLMSDRKSKIGHCPRRPSARIALLALRTWVVSVSRLGLLRGDSWKPQIIVPSRPFIEAGGRCISKKSDSLEHPHCTKFTQNPATPQDPRPITPHHQRLYLALGAKPNSFAAALRSDRRSRASLSREGEVPFRGAPFHSPTRVDDAGCRARPAAMPCHAMPCHAPVSRAV